MSSIPICSICCDKFTSNSIVQTTKCGHLFHADCIQRWRSGNTTCPECRQVSLLLQRIYLNFENAEDITTGRSTSTATIATSQEVENLVLKLSLEEAKRKNAENLLKGNSRTLTQYVEMATKKEKEHQKLLKSYQEIQFLLEEEKKRRFAAEQVEASLRKQLSVLKQVPSKKDIQVIESRNVERVEVTNLTIKFSGNVYHHKDCPRPKKCTKRRAKHDL